MHKIMNQMSADADLYAVMIQGLSTNRAFGIPLYMNLGLTKGVLPQITRVMNGRYKLSQHCLIKDRLEMITRQFNCKNMFLPFFLSPLATMHKPEERRFDPGHTLEREWRSKRLILHGRQGNFRAISLIESDGVFAKRGKDIIEIALSHESAP